MTPNDKLPEEMQEQIKQEARERTDIKEIEIIKQFKPNSTNRIAFLDGYEDGYEAGATAWAGWKVKYDELNTKAKIQEAAIELLAEKYQQLKDRSEKMEHALIKIVGMSVGENRLRTTIIEIKNIASAAATLGCKQIEKEVNP